MKTNLLFITILLSSFSFAQYTFEQIDVWSGSNGGTAKYITEFNNELYFQAAEITPSFRKLYKSDGTVAGTTQVATNLNAGAGYSPQSLTVFNGELIFTAQVSGLGTELYKTDGTEAGTVLIKDVRPGSSGGLDNASADRNIFVEFNGELYFRGSTNSSIELWKTDGTEIGTVSVKNFEGTQTGAPVYVSNNEEEYLGVVFNNELYFAVSRSGIFELWKTDGSEAGTVLVRGSFTDTISNLIVFDNQLFFTAGDASTGNEVWVTDGTAIGTQIKHDIFPNNLNPALGLGSNPDDFYIFNNEMYFSARGYDDVNNATIGRELYKTDGTLSNLVKNINTTVSGSSVERSGLNLPKFKSFANELYFTANDGADGNFGLWKTDGTEAGTVEMVASSDIGESFQFLNATEYNGNLFFFNTQQLWVTDGTASGTELLTDINGVNSDILLTQTGSLLSFNNRLWFEGLSNANGSELTSLLDATLSSGQNNVIAEFKLYPNPTRDMLHIRYSSLIKDIEIYSSLGQSVLKTQSLNIDISDLEAGNYLIKVHTDKGTITKKIIKL